jgi:hypothetical protein
LVYLHCVGVKSSYVSEEYTVCIFSTIELVWVNAEIMGEKKSCLLYRKIRGNVTNDRSAGRGGKDFPEPVRITISRRVLEEYQECVMFTIDSMWDTRSFEHNIRSTSPEISRLLLRPHVQCRVHISLSLDSLLKHTNPVRNLNSCLRNIDLDTITPFTPKSFMFLFSLRFLLNFYKYSSSISCVLHACCVYP